jgi:acyl carrier protein
MMSAITSVVSEAFTRVVGEPPVRGAETTPADVGSWNSLAHVQLVFEIEQALGIQLPDDILVTQTTVGALIEAAEAAVGTP